MPILKGNLETGDFEKIVFRKEPVQLHKDIIDRVQNSFDFLKDFSKNKIIYGVNTGFGPMAQYRIKDEDCLQLQYNLIRSHASGTGAAITAPYVRAAILARLNTLSLGYSGVHPTVVNLMTDLLNKDVIPLIFEHGGVGASGDLVQLAHLALVMIGEGEVYYKGELQPTKVVFDNLGIAPMEIHLREGLAVINGTSVMTGIGIINSYHALRAIEWSVMASAMIAQLVDSFDDYYSNELNSRKHHTGQQA